MQSDSLRIDRHKLMLHPQRVADWLAGKDIAPIYMEVSPSGACNHRCVFCALDFMGYRPRFIPLELWRTRVVGMGQMGLKAIMFAGEGEPFLHKDMVEISKVTNDAGIDTAFTTNAVLLTPEKSAQLLPRTSWIKVSCNAGTPDTYATLHRTQSEDFFLVIDNLSKAAEIRQKQGSACSLGVQMVLLPENINEAVNLARIVRDIGCDYLVLKPYSQHPQSHTSAYKNIQYDDLKELQDLLCEYNSTTFSTILRTNAIAQCSTQKKSYERCLALPFWSYIDAAGNVWGCSMFLGNEHFYYGNLHESSFMEIWNGNYRKRSLTWCNDSLDAGRCRINCRMDQVNIYLNELRNPVQHINFI